MKRHVLAGTIALIAATAALPAIQAVPAFAIDNIESTNAPDLTSVRAKIAAGDYLGARVRVAVRSCDGTWCNVDVTGHDVGGFVRQSALSGVYPNEKIM